MSFGNVLITGGAGFVGSQLAAAMLPNTDQLFIIDDLSTGHKQSLPKSHKISFYQASITDQEVLEEVLPQVDYVFHLACRNLLLSVNDIEADFQTNLFGGYFLLKKTLELNPEIKRFVYTSTASVYNNADILPTPESYYDISMPYAASKFSMEHYCHVFYHLSKLPFTTLRLSNLYGPGQLAANPYCGVVAKFFEAAASGEPLIIYGNGEQTRDFTYIGDGIDAILIAASHPTATGKVFNVGTGKETTIHLLAAQVKDITGSNSPLIYQPERTIDTVTNRCLDTEKIRTEIGWKPKHSLQKGLESTYEWLKSQ
ncbi:NAD-dependent epimerase/dehydratase family protein [Sediminibacillus halophilus]|uniref:UDP-glucose 4-epimerase n=1 Tax=Sediminibacillus halophilus TaxID=482461 RepID=A0A1G9VWM8_9BACI|nr:NAD-dependent epimerase/dehydratase family protein [Sediminibacillus halophilus]SDM76678.1 UDP-glucose 4-epimerase [Sediminibacillus halophilus]